MVQICAISLSSITPTAIYLHPDDTVYLDLDGNNTFLIVPTFQGRAPPGAGGDQGGEDEGHGYDGFLFLDNHRQHSLEL